MRRVAMAASREPQSKGGFAVFLIIWCGLTALGVGSVIGGKVGLGVLALLMSAGYAISEVAIRRGSDRAVTAVALARPFFFGGWLIALAAVIIGERQSLDWVLIVLAKRSTYSISRMPPWRRYLTRRRTSPW